MQLMDPRISGSALRCKGNERGEEGALVPLLVLLLQLPEEVVNEPRFGFSSAIVAKTPIIRGEGESVWKSRNVGGARQCTVV